MRSLVVLITILLSVLPVSNYGMNSADAMVNFSCLKLLQLGLQYVMDRTENDRVIPLPPLASDSKRDITESYFQMLPPKLVGHIGGYLTPKDRNSLALASQLQRT